MDLEVKPDVQRGIQKQPFKLKNFRKDGLILQVHHTLPGVDGEARRVRFVHVAFHDAGERLAASDHRGNVFIIDLGSCKFWMLVNLGLCTAIEFSTYNNIEIMVCTVNGTINVVNTELGRTTGSLKGHSEPITKLTFANKRYCLSSSSNEAIIWDLQSNSQAHRLSMRTDVEMKQVFFMPTSNYILACFQDDAMHIWDFENFECIKQIIPEVWRTHHIRSIAFTRNGRGMVLGGYSPQLVIFALDSWSVVKLIELPDGVLGVRHIEFVPGLFDGGANKVLGVLSEKCIMYFVNIESCVFQPVSIEPPTGIRTFTCSPNGKYLAFILTSGEVNIHASSMLLAGSQSAMPLEINEKAKQDNQDGKSDTSETQKNNITRRKRNVSLYHQEIQRQIQETLDLQRLRPLLREFGQYPASYRALIWKTILELPGNKAAYVGLISRNCHPAFARLEEQYPLENRSVLKNLKRQLSCLAHWCSLFTEVKYLPLFIFPFVKVYQNDPLTCFEVLGTVIVNWCQHWFEYYPFPPVNVLAMVENVLDEHDPELTEFFANAGITAQVFAWPLLETAFTEVLSEQEWLQLWDHVLSNEPPFLLMAVVGYIITSRSALLTCRTLDDFEYYFHNQNPLDMKRFICKTYTLYEKTSEDVHPGRYLISFTPLPQGTYPVYNKYPKFTVEYQAQEIEKIRKEEETILAEEQAVVEHMQEQERRSQEDRRRQLQEDRLLRLEEAYRNSLQLEEGRVALQRERVAALRQQLHVREAQLLQQTANHAAMQQVQQRTTVLQRLLDDMVRKRSQESVQLEAAEGQLHDAWAEAQLHSVQPRLEPLTANTKPDSTHHHRSLHAHQQLLRDEIAQLQEEAREQGREQPAQLFARVSQLDQELEQAEEELAEELAQAHSQACTANRDRGKSSRVTQLESKIATLENEVQELLSKFAKFGITGEKNEQQPTVVDSSPQHSQPLLQQRPQKPQQRKPFQQKKQSTTHQHLPQNSFKCLNQYSAVPRQNIPLNPFNGLGGDVRRPLYYEKEKDAIEASMRAREEVLKDYEDHR